MRGLALGVVAALALAGGCLGEPIQLAEAPFTMGAGNVRLAVSSARRTISLERDGARVLALDPDALQLGVADVPDDARSWDPWDVAGVRFLSPLAWSARSDGADAVIDLAYGEGLRARLSIAVASGSRFTFTLAPLASPQSVVMSRVRVRTNGGPREGFYGLGAQSDSVDSRGKLRPMQLEENALDVHAPVPLVIGTSGWGMLVATQRAGTVDVARSAPDVIEGTFSVATSARGESRPLRFDLFADAPLALYREYHAVAGAARPPPAQALGPWAWPRTPPGQAAIEAEVTRFGADDLAISGMGLEAPYARAVNTFDFDPAKFPDAPGMIARAHAAGVAVALWSAPYLAPAAEPLTTEAAEQGFFPPERGPLRNVYGAPLDLTSPAAAAYWRRLVEGYTKLGIDGFKLDLGEDASLPTIATRRNVWRFADGSDERTMHHRYSGLYHRVYSDAASGREPNKPIDPAAELPFLLVRSAHWGDASLGVTVWTGDVGEGLAASLTRALSLAASGFSYAAADASVDPELHARATEAAALGPTMLVGPANDPSSLAITRMYARLHTRLFPYLWSCAVALRDTGVPIQRPLGLAFPALGVHPSDVFLLGDDLLVAPVVTRGQIRRRTALPPGQWVDFWDGAVLEGPEVEVDAPLDKLPLFLRAGAIVPMLRDTIDTLGPSTQRESFASAPGALWALIAPGPPHTMTLWDGTVITRASDGSVELRDGTTFQQGFVLELLSTPRPTDILRNGSPLPSWTWSPARSGTLTMTVPPGPARLVIR